MNAMYPGTFDPLTNGHLDVIERSSKIFSKVFIAIGYNAKKQTHFSLKERVDMVKEVCSHLSNIIVADFEGLAVNFAKKNKVKVLIRGLRTEADYVYEMQMASMNRILDGDLETIFIPTRQDLNHISSSLVKEVAALSGDISELVPKVVLKKLLN